MADLSDLSAAQTIKVAGADSSGLETYFVGADSVGNLNVKLKDGSGNAVGTVSNPVYTKEDDTGFTVVLVGTIGTTPTQFPTVATTAIDTFLIHCPSQTPSSIRLSWSLDNVTYWELAPGEVFSLDLKEHPTLGVLTQIYLKGSVAGVKYQMVINRKAT